MRRVFDSLIGLGHQELESSPVTKKGPRKKAQIFHWDLLIVNPRNKGKLDIKQPHCLPETKSSLF